jgi:hypothetical protein
LSRHRTLIAETRFGKKVLVPVAALGHGAIVPHAFQKDVVSAQFGPPLTRIGPMVSARVLRIRSTCRGCWAGPRHVARHADHRGECKELPCRLDRARAPSERRAAESRQSDPEILWCVLPCGGNRARISPACTNPWDSTPRTSLWKRTAVRSLRRPDGIFIEAVNVPAGNRTLAVHTPSG